MLPRSAGVFWFGLVYKKRALLGDTSENLKSQIFACCFNFSSVSSTYAISSASEIIRLGRELHCLF